MAQYQEDGFVSRYRDTNGLPPALAALKPWKVDYLPPKFLKGQKDTPPVSVVHIKVFGIHSTGGHSTPYYGLAVVPIAEVENFHPQPPHDGASGNHYDTYTPITNGIYEVY
ncbi:MAG: hypothetical protein RLZZ350_2505 [Verrucomicrobiota bacterium]